MAVANLGFPRIGAQRELKKSLEQYWRREITDSQLEESARVLRSVNWKLQKSAGVDFIPSGDFSFYDHVLDHILMFDVIPARYQPLKSGGNLLDLYFGMARGYQREGIDVVAMEMTKWFDTNYHYIVPEFSEVSTFSLTHNGVLKAYLEAKELGVITRPVILGPITFLLLGKLSNGGNTLSLLPKLVPAYIELLSSLKTSEVEWIQVDEPYLVFDLSVQQEEAYRSVYKALEGIGPNIMLTTYFGGLRTNTPLVFNLPVQGIHIDLVREPSQLSSVLQLAKSGNYLLSLGVVDGRNIWKTNIENVLPLVREAAYIIGSLKIVIAPSCSLLHVPVDLELEYGLDPELRSWLAFARQKLTELALVARAAITEGSQGAEVLPPLAQNKKTLESRTMSSRIHNEQVRVRVSSIQPYMLSRKSTFAQREVEQASLRLPLLPTTTVGSFPQTPKIRSLRASWRAGKVSEEYSPKSPTSLSISSYTPSSLCPTPRIPSHPLL
jgi:5-methyltetrahydropteroyltriglutamate--homocysteine methyltransferase